MRRKHPPKPLSSGASLHSRREAFGHMARALDLPLVDLGTYAISCGILRRVPAEMACRLRCVPMVFNDRHAVLVVDDPFTAAYLDVNREMLGPPYRRREVTFALTTPEALDACLRRRVLVVKD